MQGAADRGLTAALRPPRTPASSYQRSVASRADRLDAMIITNGAFKLMREWADGPWSGSTRCRRTNLGVIASPFVYEAVIRHGQDPSYVASYSSVPVVVKESRTTAWMKLFDAPLPAYLIPAPQPPGSSLSLLAALELAHKPYPLSQGESQLRAVCVLAVAYGDKPWQIIRDFYAVCSASAVAALAPRSARLSLLVHWVPVSGLC